MEDTDNNDARFDPITDIWGSPVEKSWIGPTTYPRVKADYKSAFFIVPDSSGKLYITARNPSPAYNNFGENNTSGKFGLWGIDLETCYLARQQGRTLWVCEDALVKKQTNIGYNMNRMNMSAQDRTRLASQNMVEVLDLKYGSNSIHKMRNDYITQDML
jgi:hypothetical protein